MFLSRFKYFSSCLLLVSCLVLSSTSQAANLITTDGIAVITSTLDKNIFRSRAIENALQNLVGQGSQIVESFSIVENGQVLIDQVHLASKLGIQEYRVVKEEIKGKFYHVSLDVLLNDKNKKENDQQCRRAAPPSMDLSVNLEVDRNRMPAWAIFSNNFVNQIIENHEFEPKLQRPNMQSQRQIQAASLYSLYENDQNEKSYENYYKLHTTVGLEAFHNNTFLDKNLDLKVTVSSYILRKSEKILEKKAVSYFPIVQRSLNGALSHVTRKDWPSTKKTIANFVVENLNQQLSDLDCLEFFPKINANSGRAFLNYGSLDGITSSDMFLVRNSKAKKIYFRLESLDEHRANIKVISKIEALEDFIGSEVEVVSGS